MKKQMLFWMLLMMGVSAFSQINFEPGYIIDKNGNQINCLVKNLEWRKNPKEFTYKLSGTSEELTGNIQNVKGFFVGGTKYLVFNVDYDKSTDVISEMTTQKEPVFVNETLFLKVLTEGKASLYLSSEGNSTRYFYTVNGSLPVQLIYKTYKDKDGNLEKNEAYKQQIYTQLSYPALTLKDVENVEYTAADLVPVFTAYNTSNNSESVSFKLASAKSLFHIGLRAGPRFASASLVSSTSYSQQTRIGPVDFGNKAGVRVGVSFELVFPFDKGKWSLFMDPNYQAYSSDVQYKNYKVSMKFNFVEIPVGVRHYFFLNDHSRIFANAMYCFGAGSKSPIVFEDPNINNISSNYTGNAALGGGFKYYKISAEVRYNFKQNFTHDYLFYTSDFHSFSFILGYDIF